MPARPHCKLPSFFKRLPFELQDQVLRYVLCDFQRPETSDPANDGTYIEVNGGLAEMPWEMDTRILNHWNREVRRRARRVMLVTNRLVYIKSKKVNLLPIFHAGQIPIVTSAMGKSDRRRVRALSKYFFITHQIERRGRPVPWTIKPWGRSLGSLAYYGLGDSYIAGVQEFVILWKDLSLFCRALYGADSGYYGFGDRTRHTIRLHCPHGDLLQENNIPILHPSRLLQPYRETLRGFKSFTVQGITDESLARNIELEVGQQAVTPRPTDLINSIRLQIRKGDNLMGSNRPVAAAHTYARAAQELLVLDSKGVLPRMANSSPVQKLAKQYFKLGLRQAKAWLTVLQYERAAAERDPTLYVPIASHYGYMLVLSAKGRRLQEERRILKSLVLDATNIMDEPPRLLQYEPRNEQKALELFYTAKACRLSDLVDHKTLEDIEDAHQLDPENAEIQNEMGLIKRLVPVRLSG